MGYTSVRNVLRVTTHSPIIKWNQEKMKITFLHTSNLHINQFDKIVKEIDKYIEIEHFVNEEILETVLKTGNIDRSGFNIEIGRIKSRKFGIIICTCSTYGELCDDKDVFRIDKPIAENIVSEYSKIGIAYTASSTKKKSKNLLTKIAEKQGKQIKIKEINCEACWQWFENGDFEKYSKEIASQIKKKDDGCDVIFLAQASMEGAKKHLENERYKVVSSPKFGVEKYIELIKNKSVPNNI